MPFGNANYVFFSSYRGTFPKLTSSDKSYGSFYWEFIPFYYDGLTPLIILGLLLLTISKRNLLMQRSRMWILNALLIKSELKLLPHGPVLLLDVEGRILISLKKNLENLRLKNSPLISKRLKIPRSMLILWRKA